MDVLREVSEKPGGTLLPLEPLVPLLTPLSVATGQIRRRHGMDKNRFLAMVKKAKTRQGKAELRKHLNGKPLSPIEAIKAWCFECQGFYDEGPADCEISMCPLHPFMPYNPKQMKE